jgi:hypothetical protein
MMGDTTFFNVYQEIFALCINKFLSFTKHDIEEMPPFERLGYLEMLDDYMEEYKEMMEQAAKEQRNSLG